MVRWLAPWLPWLVVAEFVENSAVVRLQIVGIRSAWLRSAGQNSHYEGPGICYESGKVAGPLACA